MEPEGKQRIFVNEVNTMPGFTQNQHVPQAVAGLGPQLRRPDYPLIEWLSNARRKRTRRYTAGTKTGSGVREQQPHCRCLIHHAIQHRPALTVICERRTNH